jgi:predicted AAA+ superfamily ATPase
MDKTLILEILDDWNGWDSPRETGTPREALARLEPLLEERQVLAISGVRRSGKSTLLRQLGEQVAARYGRERALYVNFEDPRWLPELGPGLLEQIVDAYRERHNPTERAFLFLDEVQEVPDWERWVCSAYDRQQPLKTVVSGSTASLVGGSLGTLLTGRHLATELYPFSLRERLRHQGMVLPEGDYLALRQERTRIRAALAEQLEWGGFPEVCGTPPALARAILQQYFEDIIARDIVFRRPVRDVRTLRALAQFTITNIANELAVGQMAKTYGISLDTVREYLSCLEDAYLVSTVPYASPSLKVVARRGQKAYAVDCGLRNAVSHRFSPDSGRLAENLAFLRLREQGVPTRYWRNGGEVDFVVELDGRPLLINVSYTDSPPERELRSLQPAMSSLGVGSALVVSDDTYREAQDLPEGRIATVPLWYFLVQSLDRLAAESLGG